MADRVLLVRHGETEWSASGRHTGRTDIPLTDRGRAQADALADHVTGPLAGIEFSLVLTSPLSRARETCERAGLADQALVRHDLREWDYGDYEGRRTTEVREDVPGWTIWSCPVHGGESVDEVGIRADRVIDEVTSADGAVALFAHGHLLRVLTARWLGLPAVRGASFALDTATVSELGFERENRVIRRWNQAHHL